MKQTSKNKNLSQAKVAKNDEFYTQLSDIENELMHYKGHFKGKVVLCNCDDPTVSNFFRYFSLKFGTLGLKKLITTCYKNQKSDLFSRHDQEQGIGLELAEREPKTAGSPDVKQFQLKGDGDFRNEECIELLKEAGIVVTNPPFSLFREYVAQLIEHDKKFLIIGNKNAITYKEIFPLIRDDKIWIGNTPMGVDMLFDVPKGSAEELIATKKEGSAYKIIKGTVKARASAIWITNLDHAKRHEELILHKEYNPKEYAKYDNYDAINVDKVKDIPIDYGGVMGVPITFLDKYNPDQFEIIGLAAGNIKGLAGIPSVIGKDGPYINGKLKYGRILIKHKRV